MAKTKVVLLDTHFKPVRMNLEFRNVLFPRRITQIRIKKKKLKTLKVPQ